MTGLRQGAVRIADMVFAFEVDHADICFDEDRLSTLFLSTEKPDVTILKRSTAIPQSILNEAHPIFTSGDMWSLQKTRDKTLLAQMHPHSSLLTDRLLMFDPEFTHGEFFVRRGPRTTILLDPLLYPLGQVLMVCLLSQGRGLMFHAVGIESDGKGYLLVGNSGHGKSTMAGLWKDTGRILNDDRIVVRYQNDRFWMYSTPWHGTNVEVSAERAPLNTIFVLAHGTEHSARPLSREEAWSCLLQRSFPPLWSKQGMQFTMDFLADLTGKIPSYELEFLPQETVVDFIQCLKSP